MDEPDITRTYSPKDMEFVEDRFVVVLPAEMLYTDRIAEAGAVPTLTVIVTSEGILMGAYTQKPDEHRGTIGMTFDEWWDFIANGRFSGV